MKSIVVIGFLGTQLDSGQGAGRWEKWRPTVSLAQHEDMAVARLELLYTPRHQALARAGPGRHRHRLARDRPSGSCRSSSRIRGISARSTPRLYDWARAYPFDTEREQYWAHITTGTHVAQICMFLLVESRVIPGVLLQTSPPKRQREGDPGSYALIDLDLSRYDAHGAAASTPSSATPSPS